MFFADSVDVLSCLSFFMTMKVFLIAGPIEKSYDDALEYRSDH